MLARNWLTAEQLGLTEAERDALIEVMERLRDGRIPEKLFSMASWAVPNQPAWLEEVCPCCIAGHALRINPNAFRGENDGHTPITRVRLHDLFYTERPMERTPEEGAFAIESFLRTGKARWPE